LRRGLRFGLYFVVYNPSGIPPSRIPLRGSMYSLPFLDRTLQATTAGTVAAALQRLIVAAALGGAIGLERQIKRRPAGLRTNMFMCFGAALFTMLSALLAGSGQDQTRIAAQIIAGIGFIGAGSILHSREHVQGVTTAATIFVVAAIGMCAGAGLMFPAAMATVLVLCALLILGVLEEHIFVHTYPAAYQVESESADQLNSLLDDVQKNKRNRLIELKRTGQQVEFTLEAQRETHQEVLKKLRAEFDTHTIISFSCSEQE
jgi:putative Mg2+ transporter-C (MgtC) family protein